MPGKPKGVNAKQAAGRAKKAENEARKQAEKGAQTEALAAAEWSKGSNVRKASRDDAAALKADEAARKRREKAELLAAEEAELGSGGKVKSKTTPSSSKKKSKPKNDLALLEESLQKAADKKVRKKKQDLLEKNQVKTTTPEPTEPMDPLLANTEQMIGGDAPEAVGRQANVARMQMQAESGLDAALQSLNVSTTATTTSGGTPVKSAKALYNEFETRMLPQVKEDYPGLRLTQYKEKVWNLWKKSPENPANQEPLSNVGASG